MRNADFEKAIREMGSAFGCLGFTVRLTVGDTASRTAHQNMRIWAVNHYEGRDPFVPHETGASRRIQEQIERGLAGQLTGSPAGQHRACQSIGDIMIRDVVSLIERTPASAGKYKSKKYLEYKQEHGLHVLENTGELIRSLQPKYQMRPNTGPEDTATVSGVRTDEDIGHWKERVRGGRYKRGPRAGQFKKSRWKHHGTRPKRRRRK